MNIFPTQTNLGKLVSITALRGYYSKKARPFLKRKLPFAGKNSVLSIHASMKIFYFSYSSLSPTHYANK